MAKYNLEFKLKVVKEYLEGNIGCKEILYPRPFYCYNLG